MTNLSDLTIGQLNRIIAIKEQIENLQGQLDSVVAGRETHSQSAGKAPKRRRMSRGRPREDRRRRQSQMGQS